MQTVTITEQEAGQRLDHFLGKYLSRAGKGFVYKMMRKKNITLNGKKCGGDERLKPGDEIRLFLSDETIRAFSEITVQEVKKTPLAIVYEDAHILLINKPAGMLSQKARPEDESLVEYIIRYLLDSGNLTEESLKRVRPSLCNRLDRNTSGLVIAGKSLQGLQIMSDLIKSRAIGKFYLCIVKGALKQPVRLCGWLLKDERNNQVRVFAEGAPRPQEAVPIRTAYRPLKSDGRYTLLEVELVTGRPHQIRAHLASIGHPIAGDPKYGDSAVNREVKKKYRTDSQLLHAWRLVMPDGLAAPLSHLSGREFTADMPESMRRMAAGMHCDKGGRFHMARKTGVEIQDFEKLSCSGTCSANGSHAGPGGRGNSAGSGSESNGSRPSERLRMKTEK